MVSASRPCRIVHASVAAIMLFQVTALIVRSFLQVHLIDLGIAGDVSQSLSYLVVPVIEFALMWPIMRENRVAILTMFTAVGSWLRRSVMAIALGLTLRLCGWSLLIAATAFGWFGYAESGQGSGPNVWFTCPAPVAMTLMFVVMVIVTPLAEEVINRGLILGTTIKRGRNSAIVISATLFAILHEPQGMLAALFAGVLLAIQTIRSGSLWPSIITHATYNFLRLLDWVCLRSIWNPETTTATTTNVGILASIVFVVGVGLSIWLVLCAETGARNSPRL